MIEQDLTKIGCHGNWRRYKNNPLRGHAHGVYLARDAVRQRGDYPRSLAQVADLAVVRLQVKAFGGALKAVLHAVLAVLDEGAEGLGALGLDKLVRVLCAWHGDHLDAQAHALEHGYRALSGLLACGVGVVACFKHTRKGNGS